MTSGRQETSSIGTGALVALAVAAIVSVPSVQAAPGLTVAKDPVTGQLRAPTAEEAAALSAAPAGKYQPRGLITGKLNPAPIRHADGTIEQELDDSTQSFSVATRNPDGSVSLHCVTGTDAANGLLTKGSKASAKTAKAAKEASYEQK